MKNVKHMMRRIIGKHEDSEQYINRKYYSALLS